MQPTSSKMTETRFKLARLLVLLFVELIAFVALAQANQPNYADCMKNPFASGCRGISAKRSQLPALVITAGEQIQPQAGGEQNLWKQSLIKAQPSCVDLINQQLQIQQQRLLELCSANNFAPVHMLPASQQVDSFDFYQMLTGDKRNSQSRTPTSGGE